jgi:hypothetical protein
MRHKILLSLEAEESREPTVLDGVCELDDTYVLESLRSCSHRWKCWLSEGFFHLARQFDAGILGVFQGELTQRGGKRPAQTAFSNL